MNIRSMNSQFSKWLFCCVLLAVPFTDQARAAEPEVPTNTLPTVAWLRPTNWQTYVPGNTLLLTVQASDADGTVDFVDFFAQTNLLGRVFTATTNGSYTLAWSNAPAGIFQLHAEAVDNAGGRGISGSVFVNGTNTPPANRLPFVAWISPTNGIFSAGTPILLRARATDSDGVIRSVDFFAGSTAIGRVTGNLTNYAYMWTNPPAGTFQLHAEAVDDRGGRGISPFAQITMNATNAPPTNSPPLVDWISPTNGAGYVPNTSVFLTARATDADGTISFVEFFAGALSLGRGVVASMDGLYTLVWSNAPVGIISLHAEAYDNSGSRGISPSVVVHAITNAPPPPTNNLLPVVTWIRPINGTNLVAGSPTLLTARATDMDGTIAFVDFFIGSTLLGRVSGAMTNYNLTWTNPPPGIFQLHAEAVDNRGGRGNSALVQVSVTGGTNAPPTNNVVPVVNWMRPTNGAVLALNSPVILAARATDVDGSVRYVEFFAGSMNIGRGRGSPTNSVYTLTWSNAPAGTVQLHAEAVDDAGGRGVSGSVQITIGNGMGIVDLGIVEASTIGHAFITPLEPEVDPRNVVDYLIDQSQASGGGGVLSAASVNWDTNTQFRLTVSAPAGTRFLVDVPPGRAARFGGYLWWQSTAGGFSPQSPVAVSFTDLEGAAPSFSGSVAVLSDSHGFFGFADVSSTLVTNTFAFRAITLTGTVAPQFTGGGLENYSPDVNSSLRLSYSTTEADDPGHFVSIVPVSNLPRLDVLGLTADAGTVLVIFGRPGRTHVVECSPDTVSWVPISTNVMPATVCAVCPFMAVSDRGGTTQDNRFYRVVELP